MSPRPRPFSSYKVGERYEYTRRVTEADVNAFADLSGDDNAIHLDEEFARGTRFGGRVVHGALTFGFMAAAQTHLVGPGVIWLDARVRFTAPVRIGDTVITATDISGIDPAKRLLHITCTARVWDGAVVMEGESTLKHLREADP